MVECEVSVESISQRLFQNLDSVDKKRLHTFVVYKRMIMKRLILMVAALLMLFATDSFAGPKPKEKHFYLDKEKQLYYEGMAVKKTPNKINV